MLRLVLPLLLLASCNQDTLPSGGGQDGGDEVDAAPDLFMMMSGCKDDSMCKGTTPRCDRNTSQCVPCLPVNDNCPQGEKCVASNNSFICSSRCVADGDCPQSDAGKRLACCDGACLDTTSDTRSCGKCGSDCPVPANASAACIGGLCTLGSCNAGFLDCDNLARTGCEVDGRSDAGNCGSCGRTCKPGDHQTSACMDSACKAACDAGFADCDTNPANGCEVTLATDAGNCGGCGRACALANASAVCRAGACAIDGCNGGFGDCNMMPGDGCEIDLNRDLAHCGICANACVLPHGVPSCRNGGCGIVSCDPGFADCDSFYLNGCEAMTQTDPKNCGACGHACAGGNSTQECRMGACVITACNPGFFDCDMKTENGCETDIAEDVMSCGVCGKVCPLPANATTAACVGGVCGVGQCKFGVADCNKMAGDGCETDLLTVQSCGACDNVCVAPPNASPGCKAGQCGIGACTQPFADCNNLPMDGCEINLSNDMSNCGKCGQACSLPNATPACVASQCAVSSCAMGWGDCDKVANNGCESLLFVDPANCGGCGNVCPMDTPYCDLGMCTADEFPPVWFLYYEENP